MNFETFSKNVKWNLEQIAVQVGHAEQVKTRARSGYYKSAIILAAAVAEALAYTILEKNKTLKMPMEDWHCVRSHFLPKHYLSKNGERLSLCERVKPEFVLNKQTDFKKVNNVCFSLDIFSIQLFKKIEKVRRMRNKIHIQGLEDVDRSYTKHQLQFVLSVVVDLLKIIRG